MHPSPDVPRTSRLPLAAASAVRTSVRDARHVLATGLRWERLVARFADADLGTLFHLPTELHRPPTLAEQVAADTGYRTLRRRRARRDRLVRIPTALGVATASVSVPLDNETAVAVGSIVSAVGAAIWVVRWILDEDWKTTRPVTDQVPLHSLKSFSRWILSIAHTATVRATSQSGAPDDTEARMAEALYTFACTLTDLDETIRRGRAAGVCDDHGRLHLSTGLMRHYDLAAQLSAHQARVLDTLDLFESTAREVILAARAEQALPHEPGDPAASLLDLQAEALVRREALARLDGRTTEPAALPARARP